MYSHCDRVTNASPLHTHRQSTLHTWPPTHTPRWCRHGGRATMGDRSTATRPIRESSTHAPREWPPGARVRRPNRRRQGVRRCASVPRPPSACGRCCAPTRRRSCGREPVTWQGWNGRSHTPAVWQRRGDQRRRHTSGAGTAASRLPFAGSCCGTTSTPCLVAACAAALQLLPPPPGWETPEVSALVWLLPSRLRRSCAARTTRPRPAIRCDGRLSRGA